MTMFDRYELRDVLGVGGFATVHRAWDTALGREVALKVLFPHLAAQPDIHRRFLVEARAMAGLHHPNIAVVYDVGAADGQPVLTMELVRGQTLEALKGDGGQLPLAQVVEILSPLASAVDHVHAAGLAHRDITPVNATLDATGRVVLMDFGIARVLEGTIRTSTGILLGTPRRWPPNRCKACLLAPPLTSTPLGFSPTHCLPAAPPALVLAAAVDPKTRGVGRLPDRPARRQGEQCRHEGDHQRDHQRGDRRLSTWAVGYVDQHVTAAAGVEAKAISPYSRRHPFALRALRRGGNVVAVSRLLGYASIVTTQRYVDHLAMVELRAAVPTLP